ncbi:integrase catalytic domain-containing protein [Trichonephila clavipes]|nr:integrase catalytic domain-containing protein [Trichonephila clavipes]
MYKIKVKNILARKAQGGDVLRFTDPGTKFKLPNIELPTFDVSLPELQKKKIRWKFNPPSAPWWGGWWEHLVQMTKAILRKILGRAALDYEGVNYVVRTLGLQLLFLILANLNGGIINLQFCLGYNSSDVDITSHRKLSAPNLKKAVPMTFPFVEKEKRIPMYYHNLLVTPYETRHLVANSTRTTHRKSGLPTCNGLSSFRALDTKDLYAPLALEDRNLEPENMAKSSLFGSLQTPLGDSPPIQAPSG